MRCHGLVGPRKHDFCSHRHVCHAGTSGHSWRQDKAACRRLCGRGRFPYRARGLKMSSTRCHCTVRGRQLHWCRSCTSMRSLGFSRSSLPRKRRSGRISVLSTCLGCTSARKTQVRRSVKRFPTLSSTTSWEWRRDELAHKLTAMEHSAVLYVGVPDVTYATPRPNYSHAIL